ncbi:MAG: AtpZ/AtpI family protein [Candidatus Moraniibacteriota bacterium]|nr:MAG: AtpZ/AtpI family protein [Candidatus Moranbacteria bacterium]
MISLKKKEDTPWSALNFAWELGYIIVIPLILGVMVGKYIDFLFKTSPIFFLLSLFFSIVGTAILVYRRTLHVLRSLEQDIEKKKKK